MLRLQVKVAPGAGREGIAGWLGDRLKLRVTAPPEKGKANGAVVDLLAKVLGVPRARVRIVAGASSPLKTVEADVPDPEAALRRLPPRD
jgi:hypothetical protein